MSMQGDDSTTVLSLKRDDRLLTSEVRVEEWGNRDKRKRPPDCAGVLAAGLSTS